MNDEITSSADDQRLSVGPRIEIADDDQQSGVDRSTDSDSVDLSTTSDTVAVIVTGRGQVDRRRQCYRSTTSHCLSPARSCRL